MSRWVRKAMVSTDRYDYLLLTEADAPKEWHFAPLAVMTQADADEALRLLREEHYCRYLEACPVCAFLKGNG